MTYQNPIYKEARNMGMSMSYSMHLGSDKNKTSKAQSIAKSNKSGTTSLSNNSIQNSGHLTKADKHNIGKYEQAREHISIIYGTDNITNDIKDLYLKEFETARIEYNNNQTREDRKIEDYFKSVDKNANRDLACEIIIELGDMEFWKDKDKEYQYKMEKVFKEQLKDLERIIPEFKLANAVIHFDESSPHLHIIGVPVKEGYTRGMKKQVAKSLVFTKESLTKIQDEMRICCINSFNKEYGTDYELKTKEKGRNIDIPVSKMQGYRELKKQHENNKKRLEQANKKTDVLAEKTDKIETIIIGLKQPTLNKKNYIISNDSIEKLKEYMQDVRTATKSIKGVNDLDVIINEYGKDLKEHDSTVRSLNNTIQKQEGTIKELFSDLEYAKETITKQKEKISFLQEQVAMFKGLWKKLWRFFENKVRFGRDETYTKIANELHDNKIFNSEDIQRIKTGYVPNSNKKKKNYEL